MSIGNACQNMKITTATAIHRSSGYNACQSLIKFIVSPSLGPTWGVPYAAARHLFPSKPFREPIGRPLIDQLLVETMRAQAFDVAGHLDQPAAFGRQSLLRL